MFQSLQNPREPKTDVFWGEMAACDHFVQIYAEDSVFIDALDGFIGGGLVAGESCVVIATEAHRVALDARLVARGLDIDALRASDQYIVLDAEATLGRFMVKRWPDDDRFEAVVGEILDRARKHGTRVRAFGEMVAALWARGDHAATVRLEHLWQQLCRNQTSDSFSLFCAYPRAGFTKGPKASIQDLCTAHAKLLEG